MSKLSDVFNNLDPDQPIIAEIPLDMIYVPDGKKVSFAKEDKTNQALINSMEREGLLQPIGLRFISDEKLEVVWGRRRLWAAKQLKWTKIMAHVGIWKENIDALLVSTIENLLRKQMNPAEEGRAQKAFMEQWMKVHNHKSFKSVGGLARARMALRDPVTKKFLAAPRFITPGIDDLLDTNNDKKVPSGAPAVTTVVTAGSTPISEEGTNVGGNEEVPTKTIATRTGRPYNTSRKTAAYLKVLTDEQLHGLGTCDNVTKKDLMRLAKMEDPAKRVIAIRLICMGGSTDAAIKEALSDSDSVNSALEHMKETEVSDKDWVKIYCARVYEAVENPEFFERAAILYRKTLTDRAAYAARVRKFVLQAHEDCATRFTWHMVASICICHPDNWTVCRKCVGRNTTNPGCDQCGSEGFELKFEWPKRRK
jgi:ParB/RepB/Spo0J family partition protein